MKQKSICRVHWVLWSLPSEFKGKYNLVYDYLHHKYCFYRLNGKKLYDLFIVIRTSKRVFRVSYVNAEEKTMAYFSCRTSTEVGEKLYKIYKGEITL